MERLRAISKRRRPKSSGREDNIFQNVFPNARSSGYDTSPVDRPSTGGFASTPRKSGIVVKTPTARSAHPAAFRWSSLSRSEISEPMPTPSAALGSGDQHDLGNRECSLG